MSQKIKTVSGDIIALRTYDKSGQYQGGTVSGEFVNNNYPFSHAFWISSGDAVRVYDIEKKESIMDENILKPFNISESSKSNFIEIFDKLKEEDEKEERL